MNLFILLLGKADNKGTVGKKNFNRFTAFVKSGFESYILGSIKIPLQESDKITILVSSSVLGHGWLFNNQSHNGVQKPI